MMHPCALVYDEESNDDEDSDDDNDSNGDGDSPPDIVSTSYKCNWTFILNGCKYPQLQPLKFTTVGCNKILSILSVKMHLSKGMGAARLPCYNAACTIQNLHLLLQNR